MSASTKSAGPPDILWVGCGSMGQHCLSALCNAGYAVTATRRSKAGLQQLPPGVEGLLLDVNRAAGQAALRERPWRAVIVTLSADPDPESYRHVYVEGLAALIAALESNPVPPPLLFASSSSVYAQDDGSLVDESSATLASGFSASTMLQCEALLAASPLTTIALRFCGLYGGGRGNHLLSVLQKGRICPVQPARFSNRIHLDDCAGIILHLLQRLDAGDPVQDIYLACDGNPAPLREVMEWLARQHGVDQASLSEDYRPGRGGNRRCSPSRLLAEGWRPCVPDYRAGWPAGG